MRRLAAVLVFVAIGALMLASVAWAHEGHEDEETSMGGESTATESLVDSGGPEILLPAGAVLVGAGVLCFAVRRRV